jgi:hypothetical protein
MRRAAKKGAHAGIAIPFAAKCPEKGENGREFSFSCIFMC